MLPTFAHVAISTPNTDSTGKRGDRSEEEDTRRNARRQRRAARYSSKNCTACDEKQPNQQAHYGGCTEDPEFRAPSDVSSSDEEDEECETCEPDATTVIPQPFYPTRSINSADVGDASNIVFELLRPGAPRFQYDHAKTANENAGDLVNLIVSYHLF